MGIEKELIVQYNPEYSRDVIDYNPVCWDNNIHIRLTEFGTSFRDSDIFGFIDKLTFLVILIAKNELKNLKKNNPFNQVLLGKTESKVLANYVYKEVENKIYLNDDFIRLHREVYKKFPIDDIKLFPCVNKSIRLSPEKIIGDLNFSYTESIDEFLSLYKINSLEDFLFDDGYTLKIISSKDAKNPYHKFYNKVVKKKNKELEESKTKPVELW